jgi:AsmA-like C-terminal region
VIHSKIGKLLYTNMDLSNVKGDMVIRDKEAKIQNCTANAMGGVIELTGGYNTVNIAKPKFDMAFNFMNLDFQKSFSTLNTFQKLAPIGALINGKFNTKMSFSGELGKDLMPDISTLNAAGLIQTISGAIAGIKPLQEIGNKLNLDELKNFDLKDTKNYFEIANGIVTVKEFDKKVKDIALKISGTHSLTNEMNYMIKGKIPRKLLEKNPVGTAAGKGFDFLSKEAAKYGVKIDNGAFVNVQFNITGSFANPKLGIKVLGADGESTIQDEAKSTANAVINKAKDSIATRVNEEFDKVKNRAKQEADRIADSIQVAANKKIDEAKNKAIEEAKKQVGDKLGTAVGGKVDTLLDKAGVNDKAKEELNKAKEKLDKWNPFKKKKE